MDLEARLQRWGAEQCVGDVLMKLCSKLRVYSNYLSNYPTALGAIDRVASAPEVAPWALFRALFWIFLSFSAERADLCSGPS